MSPKGPGGQQEVTMTEVRVMCVPEPGGKPLVLRVKIPEPKMRAMSPPMNRDSMNRGRCPTVSEKEFYRKAVSLDRRDRYTTLSGAEIDRGALSIPSSLDLSGSSCKRNPMLDRRNRYPTICGAELKRSLAINETHNEEDGLDLSLAPWPGMKSACVRVLHLYCKVFDQFELFELIVRKNCTSCKCPREDHDVCHEEWASVRSRLGLKADESNGLPGFSDPRERGLAWAPPGLPPHKVDEYFSTLPEISVPRLGTPGERHRDRQLAFQLPKQDLARAYCRYLDLKHASSADDFMAARNEIALDIGTVQEIVEEDLCCGACLEPLKYGSLAVLASKLGVLHHPACFRCNDCKELLVDLAYCVHEDMIFCERHYAEQLKPRCSACDELIFSGEYTKAMNKDWHSGHFCCWQCDESLTGQRYVLRDEHPYCIKCYESVFANGCEECNKIIGIDSKDLSYKDKHWHEACFLCNRCRVSLVDKQFGSKVDKIYCGNCYDAQFASRCDGCGEIFRAGTKKMEYKTRQWHEKCFCCVVCKNPIGTKSFIPREQEIYCAGCYEDKFATRCVKCNKIITSGGVTYKNEPWHRDCFTCSNCNNSLAGQRFTSRDDKPYCADCFGELFAKRCTACSKPITGIGGTRFISFEDRHWHNECFICAGCKTSLVGRGFITDGDDIICPECAKAKLM
ncbi:PREDICTED: GDNF-inducible zinc finger protein 1 isoform X3 [Polistes dominula]|uniref:GDNF-inducible zinc finger protein 1 isoform X3 n=2 Tax=Polistes TaxID=7456 RepID=A0ABM1JF56_POLDO|nr:PREDICTED: GDNF-inducible zinc finger protein 1 isoform X3 [Polistes dominula]